MIFCLSRRWDTPINVVKRFSNGDKHMVTLNGFSVSISEAQEETSENYIVLRHGQTFSLRLHNGHKENGKCIPADAEIYVQGKYCGTFRVAAGQTVWLERPLNDSGKFTAYRNNTYEADAYRDWETI